MGPLCWEIKVHSEAWSPPKHQVVWRLASDSQTCTIISLEQLWQVLFPLHLSISCQFSDHMKEHLMKLLHLSITLKVICGGLAFLNAKHGTQLCYQC